MALSYIFLLSLTLTLLPSSLAGDADILTDYAAPRLRLLHLHRPPLLHRRLPPTFTVFKASMAEMPALNGQRVSYAALFYPPGSVNPPHTHPQASELLFLVVGSLQVGFVDTTNHLFTQTLQAGDIFVFPKGLLHYQYNVDGKAPAIAFGRASARTVSIPGAVFNTSIYDPILAASFKTDVHTIQQLKAGLSH